jgi:hypothetical protein
MSKLQSWTKNYLVRKFSQDLQSIFFLSLDPNVYLFELL